MNFTILNSINCLNMFIKEVANLLISKLLICMIESALHLLDVRGGLEESGVTNKE